MEPGKRRLLVVDDDEDVREIISFGLRKYFDVIATDTADKGRRLAEESSVDIVLCDARMPGVDGFTLTAQLKSNPRTATLPIFIVTGWIDHTTDARAKECGAAGCISKPFTPKDLLDVLTPYTNAGLNLA